MKNLGHVTAYGYAKSKGYVGTEEEFAEVMAEFADTAREAKDSAEDSEAYAIGKKNGIDVGPLSPAYHNNSKYYSEQAADSASTAVGKAEEASESATSAGGSAESANTDALKAEGYSVGKQDGEDVPSGEYYHNNAKYYSGKASNSADNAARSAENATDSAQSALRSEGIAVSSAAEAESILQRFQALTVRVNEEEGTLEVVM